MARRRLQKGSLILRGKRERLWVGRWREDEIRPDGKIHRVRRSEVLGTVKDYPTKRLALRALETRLAEVNSPSYRAKPTITFDEFAKKWCDTILVNHKRSTQSSTESQLRTALVPGFGPLQLKEITVERVQKFVSASDLSPTTVRNHVATLRMVWNSAKDWGYVSHDPTRGITFPERSAKEARCFTVEEMRRIITATEEPFKTMFWISAETGVRVGELAGLRPEDVDLDASLMRVRQSVWRGRVQTVKSKRANRGFVLSGVLVAHLRDQVEGAAGRQFLFTLKGDKPVEQSHARKVLYKVCDRLGIKRGGMHAFRHGNETVMAHLGAPPKLRQQRLGHSDERMMLRYEHVVTQDEVNLASKLGSMLVGNA